MINLPNPLPTSPGIPGEGKKLCSRNVSLGQLRRQDCAHHHSVVSRLEVSAGVDTDGAEGVGADVGLAVPLAGGEELGGVEAWGDEDDGAGHVPVVVRQTRWRPDVVVRPGDA